MKDLVAGMGAGVVVGVIGLAVGVTLVPVRDSDAIRGAERLAAAEPESIFAEDDSAGDIAGGSDGDDPEGMGEQDAPASMTRAEGTPASPADVRVEAGSGDEAAAVEGDGASVAREPTAASPESAETAADGSGGADAAELILMPELELSTEAPGLTSTADDEPAAELVPDTDAAPDALPPPAAQVLAPRAPAHGAVQTDDPGLNISEDAGRPQDGADASPDPVAMPQTAFPPPAFDGALPPSPLPQVGESATDAASLPDTEVVDDRPALVRNAAAEPVARDLPLMAVVLVDRTGADLIEGVPLSVAIGADDEDARARADAWRAAGAEIIAMPGVPSGADALALFDATFQALPQAATLMAEGARGLAGDPGAADAVAAALAETGHGLILRSGGANGIVRAAERAGVPTVEIFRRVDGSGRDGRAVGRYLDQAAFEARNRGAVVVIADNSPATAEGLERFLDSSRADTVALVPVSVILRAE